MCAMDSGIASPELAPAEALRAIAELRTYEEPLRRRTEGVTWMIWGVVTIGIQQSLVAAESYLSDPAANWYWALVLFGWPLVGVGTTVAAWRIAPLRTLDARAARRRALIGGAVWLPLVFGIWWALAFALGPVVSQVVPIGAAWLLLGSLNVFDATATGRRAAVVVGAAILLAGVVLAVAGPAGPGGSAEAAVTVFVAGGAPIVAGLWQTLRG